MIIQAIPVFDCSEKVKKWLLDHNIQFTCEQRFEGLYGYKDYLRFDLWLPKHNVYIEVDGQQHYQAKCNNSIEDFLKKREYARRKELFCLKHGLLLVRIVYDELDYLDQTPGFLLHYKIEIS